MATTIRRRYEHFPEGSYTELYHKHDRIYRGVVIRHVPSQPANIHEPRRAGYYETTSLSEDGQRPVYWKRSTFPCREFKSRAAAARYIDTVLDGERPADDRW